MGQCLLCVGSVVPHHRQSRDRVIAALPRILRSGLLERKIILSHDIDYS